MIFLQNQIIFLLIMYIVSISSFFLVRKYLNITHFTLLFSFILLLIFINLLFLFNFIVLQKQNITLSFNISLTIQGLIDSNLVFTLNYLSYFFFLLISLIGCSTNIYFLNYFSGEADEGKFLFWLNSFIISMILFVLSSNFYTLFLGWELIGLTSYFLINFWSTRVATVKSSMKAFVFNLASDIFFLTALVCFYKATGTTDCNTFITSIAEETIENSIYLDIGITTLTLCSSIKSVQIIGHLWLPDSMEAPVPASALIHSATLVSAGIFLICKFNILYIYYDHGPLLTFIGALTAAYGGVVASAQTDMKKLLAYSTMSHSGFLWILAVNGYLEIAIIYLFLHGLFKAATFYCVGSFIRFYGTQDTRLMGNGGTYLLGDSILMIFCAMNLAGLPFTIGVTYKTLFLKIILDGTFNPLTLGLMLIGLLSGLVYFFRLIYYSIFDYYKGYGRTPSILLTNTKYFTNIYMKLVRANHVIAIVLLVLFSIVVTTIGIWLIENHMIHFFNSRVFIIYLFEEKIQITLYGSYLIYFYSLYLFTFLSIYIYSYRRNYFTTYLNVLLVYVFVGLCFMF